MKKILITGFEPFNDSPQNPSAEVVKALSAEPPEGMALETAILPVDRIAGPARLIEVVQTSSPDAVLCLGENSSSVSINIERLAVNLLDFRIPDNIGHQVQDEPVIPDGPVAYFVTLPVRSLAEAVRAARVPCELSLSAGSFLCNQVLFTLLHHLSIHALAIPAGFIHLPSLPEQTIKRSRPGPSMSLETSLRGVRAALNFIAALG